MGLIKEPQHVDFYFNGKQMTDEGQKRISAYIKQQKDKKKIRSPKRRDIDKQNA